MSADFSSSKESEKETNSDSGTSESDGTLSLSLTLSAKATELEQDPEAQKVDTAKHFKLKFLKLIMATSRDAKIQSMSHVHYTLQTFNKYSEEHNNDVDEIIEKYGIRMVENWWDNEGCLIKWGKILFKQSEQQQPWTLLGWIWAKLQKDNEDEMKYGRPSERAFDPEA